MPRKYKRKPNVQPRCQWSEQDLQEAVKKIKAREIGINEASRTYQIPSRTLRRRLAQNKLTKVALGKPCVLGAENEARLVNHNVNLQSRGFAPTPLMVREMAIQFARKLNLGSKFRKLWEDTNLAGKAWFYSFMERHPNLSVRKSEGLSLARASGMNREDVQKFYELLRSILEKYDLMDKPRCLFNMDETGIQANNKPDRVIAQKGSKCVHVLTAKEKGENISLIACANAEGTFLPPVLILKGVRKNAAVLNGMPTGSDVYMNRQSSFITAELFMKWLKEIFVPRKPDGPVVLILDGHSSHCCNIDMLSYAEQNNIVLLCLPSHTTQALQPLDRSFFKPRKSAFKREADNFMFTNKTKNIDRNVIGKLIGPAWNKAATIQNATSGFSATGIFPYNDSIIPDYFFQISDNTSTNLAIAEELPVDFLENDDNYLFVFDQPSADSLTDNIHLSQTEEVTEIPSDKTSQEAEGDISQQPAEESNQLSQLSPPPRTSFENQTTEDEDLGTPSRFLREIAPLPDIRKKQSKRKQSAKILSSEELKIKKTKSDSVIGGTSTKSQEQVKGRKKQEKKKTISYNKETSGKNDNAVCAECLESYYNTEQSVDWIECIQCKQWIHENCTMYGDNCNDCGKKIKRQSIVLKTSKKISFE